LGTDPCRCSPASSCRPIRDDPSQSSPCTRLGDFASLRSAVLVND
jgi:hypothetical protein